MAKEEPQAWQVMSLEKPAHQRAHLALGFKDELSAEFIKFGVVPMLRRGVLFGDLPVVARSLWFDQPCKRPGLQQARKFGVQGLCGFQVLILLL